MKNRYTIPTFGLFVVAFLLLRRAEALHSNLTMAVAMISLVAGLILSQFTHPKITTEERRERLRELLDIKKPEETKQKIFEFIEWLIYIFVPILLFLRIGSRYVLLDEYRYLWILYALPILFLGTYLIPSFRELRRFPLPVNVIGRIGLCLPAIALLFSLTMVLNCAFDDSVKTRTVMCIGKRVSRGTHPGHYLCVQPWDNSGKVVEVDTSETVYAETHQGAYIEIKTGKGKLGIEWIRGFAPGGQSSGIQPAK
jgi:hypothetical protein